MKTAAVTRKYRSYNVPFTVIKVEDAFGGARRKCVVRAYSVKDAMRTANELLDATYKDNYSASIADITEVQ